MNAAALLLITTIALNTQVLVLRSGAQIEVQGAVHEDNGRLVFRTTAGALYSIDRAELDDEATRQRNETARNASHEQRGDVMKLKVDDAKRKALIAELEKNHAGTPPPHSAVEHAPELPTPSQIAQTQQDEWTWRYRARDFEEGVRRAKENRDLLVRRADYYRRRIQGLINLGFRPDQFSYDVFQLKAVEEQIPSAELEVTRAQRAYEQFLDDARRQGILPGWLR